MISHGSPFLNRTSLKKWQYIYILLDFTETSMKLPRISPWFEFPFSSLRSKMKTNTTRSSPHYRDMTENVLDNYNLMRAWIGDRVGLLKCSTSDSTIASWRTKVFHASRYEIQSEISRISSLPLVFFTCEIRLDDNVKENVNKKNNADEMNSLLPVKASVLMLDHCCVVIDKEKSYLVFHDQQSWLLCFLLT